MIGIDLVDLKQANTESNWQRKGYLDKIFTNTEQELIHKHQDPNVMVWLLWSMKEAAYKIWSRTTGQRTYAPTALVCKNIKFKESISGIVTNLEQQYFTQSDLTENYICTIAAPEKAQLLNIRTSLSDTGLKENRSDNPQSISHHGRYLAMAWC